MPSKSAVSFSAINSFVPTQLFRCACFVLFLTVALTNSALADKEKECDVVTKLAKVAVRDYDTVTVSADYEKKICRFSVNGAVADSPRRSQVRQAYLSLLGVQKLGILYQRGIIKRDLTSLTALLLAAEPDSSTEAMKAILSEHLGLLQDCTQSLMKAMAFDKQKSISRKDLITCTVIGASNQNAAIKVGPFSVRTISVPKTDLSSRPRRVPQMVLTVKRSSVWVALTVPRRQ